MANTAQSKDRAAVKGGLDDLLGNVIRNDRQRAGRGNPTAQTGAKGAVAEATEREANLASPEMEGSDTSPHTGLSPVPSPSSETVSETSLPSRSAAGITTDTHSDIMTNGQPAEGDQSQKTQGAAKVARPKTEGAGNAPKTTARPAQARRSKPAAKSSGSSASHEDRLLERVEEAGELAATPTITVTLRIPQGFNEWLDGYVHGSWPEKIRKQELVVEGLMLAYARRGHAGEEVIGTALLGENEESGGS